MKRSRLSFLRVLKKLQLGRAFTFLSITSVIFFITFLSTNVVSNKCLFRHKFRSDCSVDRYKAHWVTRGFNQQPGVDFDEIFNTVCKLATVRTVLNIATARKRPIRQPDVTNAFLHGPLSKPIFCEQPSGSLDPSARITFITYTRSYMVLSRLPGLSFSALPAMSTHWASPSVSPIPLY